METFKSLLDDILTDANGMNDDDLRVRVAKLIQKFYFKTAKIISLAPLRTKITIDFEDATDNTGLFIPSDLYGIDAIRDEDANIEFVLRDDSAIEPDEYAFRAYTHIPSQDPLKFFDDIFISFGGATFTSTKLDTYVAAGNDVTDEWITIASEPGYYKITNTATPYTIDRTYYGPDQSQGEYQIRPPESRKLVILDPAENVLRDRDVVVYYWTAPRPLYNASDRIMMADSNYLKLKVLREMPEAKKRRPVSKTELDEALAELKKLNPDFMRRQEPRDKHNDLFSFSKNLYQSRTDTSKSGSLFCNHRCNCD